MLRSLLLCIGTLIRRGETALGAALSAFGGALEMSDIYDVPLWMWFAGASGILLLMAVRLQMQLDDDPHIEKLRHQSYVSFGEIAEAVAKAHKAYDKSDALKALLRAVDLGDFKSWAGISQLKIIGRDSSFRRTGARIPFCPEELADFAENDAAPTPGVAAYERAVMWAALSENESSEAMESLLVDQTEFTRWYRRFRNGRYGRRS